MPRIHGSRALIYLNGRDISTWLSSIDISTQAQAVETSAFGTDDKTYLPGIRNSTIRFQGHWDDTAGANGIDTLLESLRRQDAESAPIVSVVESPGLGGRGVSAKQSLLTALGRSAPLNGVIAMSADFQNAGGTDHIRTLYAKGTLTPTAPGGTSAEYNGGTPTLHGLIGVMHVFGAVNGSPVVTIDHSLDGSAGWTSYLTFSTITAGSTAERVEATGGSVRPYLRVSMTGGTAEIYVGAFQPRG